MIAVYDNHSIATDEPGFKNHFPPIFFWIPFYRNLLPEQYTKLLILAQRIQIGSSILKGVSLIERNSKEIWRDSLCLSASGQATGFRPFGGNGQRFKKNIFRLVLVPIS